MENNHETNSSDGTHPDGVTHDEIAPAPRPEKGSATDGVSKSDCPHGRPRATRARRDKGGIHARNYGVLSRNPMAALIRLGENPRQLLKIYKKLRVELKPTGILGDILLDRAWASYLRCLLIARVEANLFVSGDQDNSNRMPELKEMDLPTLVFPKVGGTNYGFSDDLTKHLETALRYDGHYARQFWWSVGSLIAMQSGGLAGLLDCL
jgi:hypothetical protein